MSTTNENYVMKGGEHSLVPSFVLWEKTLLHLVIEAIEHIFADLKL